MTARKRLVRRRFFVRSGAISRCMQLASILLVQGSPVGAMRRIETMSATASTAKPAIWTPGDWNAFFGFGTNILVNMLVLTGLLRFVLKMPDSLVFGRILPAL